jgi:hypothetical protein
MRVIEREDFLSPVLDGRVDRELVLRLHVEREGARERIPGTEHLGRDAARA